MSSNRASRTTEGGSDEIEIGRTILTYVGAAAGATPSARRPRRRRRVRMPWEVLAAPVLLAVASYALVGWRSDEAHAAAAADWNRYAEARSALAQLQPPSSRPGSKR